MTCYLEASLCCGDAPARLAQLSYVTRPHLITSLLQERNVARFIVAPVGFGKTSLAYEYCKTVFSFKNLAWFDCTNPRFLRDLDNKRLVEFILDKHLDLKLVAFDDLPLLDESRQNAFSQCLDACIERHIEVLVTCEPSSDAYASLQKDRLYLPTSCVLLTNEELAQVHRRLRHICYDYESVHDTTRLYIKGRSLRSRLERDSNADKHTCTAPLVDGLSQHDALSQNYGASDYKNDAYRLFQRIPQVCWRYNGRASRDFIEACLRAARDKKELFALVTLFIVQRAPLCQLEDIVSIDADWLADFSRVYAFVDYDSQAREFETLHADVSCVLEAFRHVLQPSTTRFSVHGSDLRDFLPLSHCANVHDYFELISDVLCSRNNYARALQCLPYGFSLQEQFEWCLLRNKTLIEQYCLADSLVLLENVLPHVDKHKAECMLMCAERHFYFAHYKRVRALASRVLHDKDASSELKLAALNLYMGSGGRLCAHRDQCDSEFHDEHFADVYFDEPIGAFTHDTCVGVLSHDACEGAFSHNERADVCTLDDIEFAAEQGTYAMLESFVSNKAPKLAFRQSQAIFDDSLYWCALVLVKIAGTLTQLYHEGSLVHHYNVDDRIRQFMHLACLKEIPAAQAFIARAFSKEIRYITPFYACLGLAYCALCKENSMFPARLLNARTCCALHDSHVLLEYEHIRFQKMSPRPPAHVLETPPSPIDCSPCSAGCRIKHEPDTYTEAHCENAPCDTNSYPYSSQGSVLLNAHASDIHANILYNPLVQRSDAPSRTNEPEIDDAPAYDAANDVTGAGAPVLSVHIFGRFRIVCNGIEVTEQLCKRHKLQTLCAILLLNKEKEIPKTVLAQLLWPESSIPTARKNLYSLWSVLIHALSLSDGSCPYFTRSTHAYAVNKALVRCDIDEFRMMCSDFQQGKFDQARWKHYLNVLGEDYQDVLMLGEYDNTYVIRQRETCRAKLIEALMCAAQMLYSAGDYTAAAACVSNALHFDTTREDVVALLMRSYLAAGQRMKAITTYRAFKEELSRTIGIEPCDYVQQLYKSALSNDFSKE